MTNDLELLRDLLSRMEDSTLDFKRDQYRLESDEQKSDFVKDILCMANTPRDESAHIVIGVIDHNGRAGEIVGASEYPDPVTFQNIVNGRTVKPVRFSFREIAYLGVTVGLFEIPIDRNIAPIMAKSKFGNLKSGVIYSRRNAQNCEATSDEIERIVLWAKSGYQKGLADEGPEHSWVSFLRACEFFEAGRNYVAVFDNAEALNPEDCEAFSQINWQLVVDLDQDTDEEGLYSRVSPHLSQKKSLRLTALDQPVGIISPASCIWVAARGLSSRPSTIRTHTWREWNQARAGILSDTMCRLAEVSEHNPVTAVIFGGENSYTNTVCNLLDQAFKSRLSFVIACENPDEYSALASQFEATSVAISLPAACSGIRSMNYPSDPSESMDLPSLEGGVEIVPPDRGRWLEEELEVVHTNVGLSTSETHSELEDFLKGSLISWRALNLGVDVSRTDTPRLQQKLTQELDTRTTRRLNLWHWPGGGGSTVARRVAWNLHNQYPTVLVRRVVPEPLADRIRYLFELTRKPVLVLVEDSATNHNDLDGVYDRLRSGNVPSALLIIGRRTTASTQSGSFFVDGILDASEASAFAGKLAVQVPGRQTQLERLRLERQSQRRTPFYFGLVAFGKDFAGLERYVAHRLGEASKPLLDVVKMTSLLYHYGQKSTPVQLLSTVLSMPRSKTIAFALVAPNLLRELFVQETDRSVRPAHELIAEEMLIQILSAGSGDKRIWRSGLAQCAVDVMEYCAEHHDHQGGATADLVRSVMIERGIQETPAGPLEGQFSNLIDDIPSSDGQRRVLEGLTELFPDEAHFWAHLGRFYTRRAREHSSARESHNKSLQLAPQDPVLYHMAGMACRGELDDLLDRLDTATIEQEEQRVQSLADEALSRFKASQELDPRREHSYISAIELITRLIRTVGRLKGYDESTAHFLITPKEVWYRELVDKAESLLADLTLVRAGEESSQYMQRAQANLAQAYGELSRAIEGWTNLLDRSDTYHPPLRRNIINAYLTRRDRDWARLRPNELERIAQLAQENLEEQPSSDQNLRIWFRAVREVGELPLGHIAEQLAYKRLLNPTIDTLYYLYIVKFLQDDAGVGRAASEAIEMIAECERQTANLPNRTRSFEWLGNGTGIRALIHGKALGPWDPSSEFWSSIEKLRLVDGRISSIRRPAAGDIDLPNGLKAFFVPARGHVQGGYLRGRDEGRRVSFFLGFSYEGLRAWSIRDADGTQV